MGPARVQAASRQTRSPRHLVLGKGKALWTAHKNQQLRALRDAAVDDDNTGDDGPPKLPPGQEQLFSLYAPALVAGSHTISVLQSITPPDGATDSKPLHLTSSKDFDVIAPRFWLPTSDIHSVYPPQGHADHNNILPHMVFSDEHLPWERSVSTKVESPERSRIPWLALLVFTQDELRLKPEELAGDSRIFPSDVVQSTTLSVSMTLNDIWKMVGKNTVISPVIQDDPVEKIDPVTASTKADFIFVTKDHIDALFRSYNDDGSRKVESVPDLVKYKYLSHVRNINTEGMTNVGSVDEFGEAVDQLFSVVVGHRTGPWNSKSPTPVVVHLVTLEGVEPRIDLSKLPSEPASYVSLCSLYSWTYQYLPNDSINFYDAMVHLGSTYQPLRAVPPKPSNDAKSANVATPAATQVAARMNDGYTLTRWRVKSGETTAAMVRGPFVPTSVPRNPQGCQSTFSTDLQILDRQTGIMDISYSLAWQLGKTMAIADQAFTAAVARLRGIIHDRATQALKGVALGARRKTAVDVVANLQRDVALLGNLHKKSEGHTLDPVRKWKRTSTKPLPKLGFFDPTIQDNFLEEAKKVAKQLASSLDAPEDNYWFYNEHNRPFSTDWALMLKWILDRMYFVGLPAHYLIADPAHLPAESLRFFSVDANWVDAFVDGSLSICCHLEPQDDDIRTAIKGTIEEFRKTPDPVLGYAPQIPTYGFLLRSAVVKMFPDLIVKAPPATGSPPIRAKMAAILRQENIDEQVMLVLLDRQPGDGLLGDLTISQPPHQQCFAAAVNVGLDTTNNENLFEVSYDQIYTTTNQPTGEARKTKLSSHRFYQEPGKPCLVFDFDSRMMIVQNYAENVLSTVQQYLTKDQFSDTVASAALMGIQLNDPTYQLSFDLSQQTKLTASTEPAAVRPVAPSSGMKPKKPRRVRQPRDAGREPSELSTKISYAIHSAARKHASTKTTAEHHPRAPAPHAKLLGVSSAPEHLGPLRTTPAGTVPRIPGAALTITCKVHGQTSATIATNTGYSVDLVFAAQITGDVQWLNTNGFLFTGVFIYLPIYSAPSKTTTGTSSTSSSSSSSSPPPAAGKFMTSYRGSGSRMLANLRFNPLLVPSSDLLCASLFPRTASGGVDLKASGFEMGFILNEVDIAPYAKPQLPLKIAFMERYVNTADPQRKPIYVNSSFFVTLAPS